MAVTGITTFLWFDTEALAAAEFYVSLFPGASMGNVSYYPESPERPAGSVLVAEFSLFGQAFAALNGGPQFPHSEAISFQVHCDTQDEIDHLWDGIVGNGGAESMCGWCKDRWGVSWQIVPRRMGDYLGNSDPAAAGRAYSAMMTMRRLDIAAFEAAIAG